MIWIIVLTIWSFALVGYALRRRWQPSMDVPVRLLVWLLLFLVGWEVGADRSLVRSWRSLGADDRLITRIFLFEGRLISGFGALAGIIVGLILCYLQQAFGLISLGDSSGSFVVDAYPVSVHLWDVVLIFATVVLVSYATLWYPVRYLSKRLLD